MTTQQTDPVQTDNSAAQQAAVVQPVTAPVASTDNADITPEKKEELSRKLHSSKEEALRLKEENERLARENEELRLSQVQPAPSTDTQVSEHDVAYLKALGKKAGFAFQEDVQKPLQAIRQETYKERQQAEWHKFLEKHPEYNKEGDPQSDQLFNTFMSELRVYKEPSEASQWGRLFEKAHKFATLNEQTILRQGEALGYAKQNIANQIGGSSYGGTSAPVAQNLSPERQAVSEGFAQVVPHYYKKK